MRSRFAWIVVALVVGLFSLGSLVSDDTPLEPWHSENLTEEFTIRRADEVRAFDDYGALEDRLFAQLDAKVYGPTATGPENALVRYSNGSAADPERRTPNWNRSFELPADAPLGGAPLLHGMTDSPYSRVWEGLLGCRFALSSILISTALSPPMPAARSTG